MVTAARAPLTHDERRTRLHGVYAILNEGARDPLKLAQAALEAGVRVLQYRAKAGIVPELVRALREVTRAHGALLLMNDDSRAAVAFDCDGVHLGPGDDGFADLQAARRIAGDRLIGLSCASADEARKALADGADYVGVGSVYATGSKADAGAPIGVEGLRGICAAVPIPVAAVGGITVERVPEVRNAGAAMAAIISALAEAIDPFLAARRLVEAWKHAA
jgi:thiamine-phosphate pyrophosphorylase